MNKPKDAKEKIEPSFGSYKREWEVKEKAVEIQSFIDFLNELRNKLKYVSDIKFMKKLITYLNTTHDCEEQKLEVVRRLNNIEEYNEKLQKENTELKEKIKELTKCCVKFVDEQDTIRKQTAKEIFDEIKRDFTINNTKCHFSEEEWKYLNKIKRRK